MIVDLPITSLRAFSEAIHLGQGKEDRLPRRLRLLAMTMKGVNKA